MNNCSNFVGTQGDLWASMISWKSYTKTKWSDELFVHAESLCVTSHLVKPLIKKNSWENFGTYTEEFMAVLCEVGRNSRVGLRLALRLRRLYWTFNSWILPH